MRRFVAGLLFLLPVGSGASFAQSVTALSGSQTSISPSIIRLGSQETSIDARPLRRSDAAAAELFSVSRSVLAYGADAIAPARDETVAALPAPAATPVAAEPAAQPVHAAPVWRADSMPFVIRGGVVGDAFSSSPAPSIDLSRGETPAPVQAAPEPVAEAPARAPDAASRPEARTRQPL